MIFGVIDELILIGFHGAVLEIIGPGSGAALTVIGGDAAGTETAIGAGAGVFQLPAFLIADAGVVILAVDLCGIGEIGGVGPGISGLVIGFVDRIGGDHAVAVVEILPGYPTLGIIGVHGPQIPVGIVFPVRTVVFRQPRRTERQTAQQTKDPLEILFHIRFLRANESGTVFIIQ